MEYNLDIERLRHDLVDYFGTAAASGIPGIVMEMFDAQTASPEELVEKAMQNGFYLQDYIVDNLGRKF